MGRMVTMVESTPSDTMPREWRRVVNSRSNAFAKLARDGLLQRSGRGNYEPNYAGIVIHLMERIEALEKQAK